MRLLFLCALAGLAAAASNVTFFGTPRLSLGDTLPNRNAHGDVVAQISGVVTEKPTCGGGSSANARSIAYYQVNTIDIDSLVCSD